MNKQEIIKYLQDNPGWVLQYQHGINGIGWWWLRDMNQKSNTIDVDGRSANAARAMLQTDGRVWFGETNYVLPTNNKPKITNEPPEAPAGLIGTEIDAWKAGWKAGWKAATGQKS